MGESSPTNPPPEPQPGSTTFDLRVSGDWNDSARALKNGASFTARMNQIYNGLLNHWLNGPGQSTSGNNLIGRINSGDAYNMGRDVLREVGSLLIFLRLTGDLRLLNELGRLSELAYASMRTTWAPGHTATREPHGGRFWAWLADPNYPEYGTDNHDTDTPRSFRVWAEVAWAFELNRDVDGGAYDFGALSDKWKLVFYDYEKVWTAVDDSDWPPDSDVPGTYKGYWMPGGSIRPAANQWPTNRRTFTHTNHGCMNLQWFMGHLLGKPNLAYNATRAMLKPFIEQEVLTVTANGRDHAIWGRSWQSLTTSNYYSHPITYAEYSIIDTFILWLEGAFNDIIDADHLFAGIAHSYADWVIRGGDSSEYAYSDISGRVVRTGTNQLGQTITLPTSAEGGFSEFRSKAQYGLWAHNLVLAWDSTGKMETHALSAWNSYWTGGGGLDKPNALCAPLGVFLKDADIANTTPAAPPPGGGGGTELSIWSLAGVEDFSSNNPRLKDGRLLTGDALRYYRGLEWFAENNTSMNSIASSDNTYNLARPLRDHMMSMLIGLRLTGDLRFLDKCLDWSDLAFGTLRVGWRGLISAYGDDRPAPEASPYKMWPVRGEGFRGDAGTDFSRMNEQKWHAALAALMYACYLNRNLDGRHNYQAQYDKIKDYFDNHFIPKWRDGSGSWAAYYKGVSDTSTYRQSSGKWPIVSHSREGHSTISGTHLSYFWGKLTGDPSASQVAVKYIEDWLDIDARLGTGPYGTCRIWPHNLNSRGSTATYAQGSQYCGYESMDMLHMYLEGGMPTLVNRELLQHMARTLQAWLFLPNFRSITDHGQHATYHDIIGGVNRFGYTNSTSQNKPSTLSQTNYSTIMALLPFASSSDNTMLLNAQYAQNHWTGGGFDQPRTPHIVAAMLLREVGA